MLNTAGLSLEQAPPISIPFRFFLLAPLFGIAAGALLLVVGEEALLSRWSPVTLALTHLLTLGLLGMVMCGAMLQILPVIAGSPVPRVVLVGTLSHLLLVGGILVLQGGFFGLGSGLMELAIVLLGSGFLVFASGVSMALWRVRTPSPTIVGMRLAVAALIVTVVLGTLLAGGYAGLFRIVGLAGLTDTHLAWGLAGWIGLLLMSVSFQVVPMFQVTPEYPAWFRRWVPGALFVGLLLWMWLRYATLQLGWSPLWEALWSASIGAVFALYAGITLRLQQRRKRRVVDVTLLFWRLAMICLLLLSGALVAVMVWPNLGSNTGFPLFLGIVLLLGVALPAVNGMLYKIVPFLSWFHLQKRQLTLMCMTVPVPHMRQFVSDAAARRQYHAAWLALLSALLAVIWPSLFARVAGGLFALSNLLLLGNLLRAMALYHRTAVALSRCADDPNSH